MANTTSPDASGASNPSASDGYAQQWLRLCRMLDVDRPEAALDRVETLLNDASATEEPASSNGLLPIDEVENVFATMNAKLERLEDENDDLKRRLQQKGDVGSASDLPGEWTALLDVLDADTVDEVAQHVDDLTGRIEALEQDLDRVREERNALRKERDALREEREAVETDLPSEDLLRLAATLRDALGVDSAATAQRLTGRIRTMHDRLQALQEERATLADAVGVSDPADVPALIESMDAQLKEIYEARQAEAPDRVATDETVHAIRDVLGVRTETEARALKAAVLTLVEDRDATTPPDDADSPTLASLAEGARMIESMDAQLNDLYERHENAVAQALSAGIDPEMDLADQLQVLVEERERVMSQLGVTSMDAVITMVKDLSDQLDVLYAERDAAGDADGTDSDAVDETDPAPVDDTMAEMLVTMREQLEVLYEEKEVLIEHDLADAETAVARIEALEQDVASLQAENDRLTHALRGVRTALHTDAAPADVASLVRVVRSRLAALAEAADASTHQLRRNANRPVHTAPPVVDDTVVQNLARFSEDELDALDVGILRLAPDGTIAFVNTAALPVPGIPGASSRGALEGRHFFESAPGVDQHPFFRRFRDRPTGLRVDDRFPYLILRPNGDPAVLIIHLYAPPHAEARWILFRSL